MKFLYRYFYNSLEIPAVETDAYLHLLNPAERKAVHAFDADDTDICKLQE